LGLIIVTRPSLLDVTYSRPRHAKLLALRRDELKQDVKIVKNVKV